MSARVGSLFTGAAGLDMAVTSALEAEIVWQAEYEPPTEKDPNPRQAAAKVLAHRFPGVPNLGDVSLVDWSTAPPVDGLCGGFPCQDMSNAGLRGGLRAGTRSGLWSYFRDAIASLHPRFVLIENVRGILNADADSCMEPCAGCVGDEPDGHVLRALGRVLGDLADLGFDAEWTGLRASDVGAPHGRFRIFILAWPAGDPDGAARLQRWITAPGQTTRGGHSPTLADQVEHLMPTPGTSDTNGIGMHGEGGLDLRTAVSLLPTPMGDPASANGHARNLAAEVGRLLPTPRATRGGAATETMAMLPTPRTTDGKASMHAPAARQHVADGNGTLTEVLGAHLFPTPRATDGTNGGPNQKGSSGDLMLPSAVAQLFPTPSVADALGGHGARGGDRSDELLLKGIVQTLLPTPTGSNQSPSPGASVRPSLEGITDWGIYGPAVRRWASITRPAPAPTETAPKGGRRLSCRFDEWLLGWPDGWVTDVPGVTHNDALRLCGNGVVTPQGVAALRELIHRALRSLAERAA